MATALSVRRPWCAPSFRPIRTSAGTLDIDASFVDGDAVGAERRAAAGLGWVDLVLIFIFMAGLYTNYTVMLSRRCPFRHRRPVSLV